jgi:hypothetical protein
VQEGGFKAGAALMLAAPVLKIPDEAIEVVLVPRCGSNHLYKAGLRE